MRTFNLAQALKQKNRLAGEIARAREIVQRENTPKDPQSAGADVRAVFDQCIAQSRELAAFKGAITAVYAGVLSGDRGIYGKLNLQAELRGLIVFLKALAPIARDEGDRLVAAHQAEIEQLQDEIDKFNATTRTTHST